MFAAEAGVTFSAVEVKVGIRLIAVAATTLLARDLRLIDSVLPDNTSLFIYVTRNSLREWSASTAGILLAASIKEIGLMGVECFVYNY
jgi:hypothetical protein